MAFSFDLRVYLLCDCRNLFLGFEWWQLKAIPSIQEQIVHIRVRDGGADAVVADGLYNVHSLGQQIFCDCPGKQRVILKDGQAVADTVADAAFLGAFQHGLYFLNAPGRGCFLYGLFCGLPYLGRQALPFVFQDCSLPFHSQR